jgi:protoporphyrinogen oxidase
MAMSGGARHVARLQDGDHVVVIGAGPAGLTAAYLLSSLHTCRVTVLEADAVVGGLARTVEYRDYRFDVGGHRFFTRSAAVEQLWREILGDDFIDVRRLSRILYNGRFFDYPLRLGNAFLGLGPWNAIAIVASYLKWHFRAYPTEDNFEQYVTNRFGRRLYETFFKTYTEKVWGIPCREIRAEWAAQRIRGLSLLRAVRSATPLRHGHIRSLVERFHYPRLGPGQMWEAARDRVVERGHRVLMQHAATSIERSAAGVTAVHAATPDGSVRIEADHVITTMPLQRLARAMTPAAPPDVLAAADGLRYRDFILVALILDDGDIFPDNWIYVHTPGVQVGRIQNFKNWSAAMVPDPKTTCLGMEYFCFAGDGLWTSSDDALIAQAAAELATLGLAPGRAIIGGTVVRMPKAYPIYDGEYRRHLATLQPYLDAIPNLHTVGRNGLHRYNNQDHSMIGAMMAVANLQGGTYDVWSSNSDLEYQEESYVETIR